MMMASLTRLRDGAARLRRCESGVALVEFAFSMPIILGMGMYGLEVTNYAMTHMQVSQIALGLADNASRIGQDSALSLTQFRESDVNDTFEAAKKQAGKMDITTHGRIILSSLERNADGGQWIHWQRCIGLRQYDSSYGVEGDGATGTSLPGMGPATERITAPDKNAVMFVEISYDYQPLISDTLIGKPKIRYTAAFIVRDERDLSKIYNPAPEATKATCNKYTT
ncbi:TadE/TadG family type IV pilus assembly protein [Sphingomonas flavalba]|uniref:TadE/TadG family type IV pilus assembly protein n=1 Tax=Sphingomonas flavalba TaxID=2559804 RepID=UPI0039E1FD24